MQFKRESTCCELLAVSLARMPLKHGFLLTAWVFHPDHWHAIVYPPYPVSG